MDKLFEQIAEKLSRFDGVIKVDQLGSVGDARDKWSDIDVGVLVESTSLGKFFPTTDWIRGFGEVFATSQYSGPGKATTRVVFRNLTRVDFSFVSREEMHATSVAAPTDEKVLSTVTELLNDFCFEAIHATSKLGRTDNLIGMHLILGLEQKCLVVAMMLSDQEHGTIHHRHGGFLNEVADRLAISQRLGLPDRIRASCSLFGELALKLDPSLEIEWSPIIAYLDILDDSSSAGNKG
jgi:Streptomycin adenylyltransferase